MGAVYKRGRVYWLKFYDHGRPIYESAKTRNYEEAKRLLKLREGSVADGLKAERPAERITVEVALAAVVMDCKMNQRRSLKHLERRIMKYLLPLLGTESGSSEPRKLADLTAEDVKDYAVKRQEAGASNAEVNRELGVLSYAFKLAIESKRVAAKPKFPRLTESAPRSGFFEREQLEAIVRYLPEYVQPAVRFMYETGWRTIS
jgi:hypothetical protein